MNRLNDMDRFAPVTYSEEHDHGSWESDVDKAIAMTEPGRLYDPFGDIDLLHQAIDSLTEDALRELAVGYHCAGHQVFGEVLCQQIFKTAFAEAWRSLQTGEDVPDI